MCPDDGWHPEPFENPEDDEGDAGEQAPQSWWSAIAEVGGGVVALFLIAAAVIAMYVAGGIFAGLLATAAPAVAALVAAVLLARYLSRRGDGRS